MQVRPEAEVVRSEVLPEQQQILNEVICTIYELCYGFRGGSGRWIEQGHRDQDDMMVHARVQTHWGGSAAFSDRYQEEQTGDRI